MSNEDKEMLLSSHCYQNHLTLPFAFFSDTAMNTGCCPKSRYHL